MPGDNLAEVSSTKLCRPMAFSPCKPRMKHLSSPTPQLNDYLARTCHSFLIRSTTPTSHCAQAVFLSSLHNARVALAQSTYSISSRYLRSRGLPTLAWWTRRWSYGDEPVLPPSEFDERSSRRGGSFARGTSSHMHMLFCWCGCRAVGLQSREGTRTPIMSLAPAVGAGHFSSYNRVLSSISPHTYSFQCNCEFTLALHNICCQVTTYLVRR